MPNFHRRHVDVCSCLCVFCCSEAPREEPAHTADEKVKRHKVHAGKVLGASPVACGRFMES